VAKDLIPPPSPAGRPDPEGGGPTGAPHTRRLVELPPEPAEGAVAASAAKVKPAEPVGPSPFRTRFGFIAGALVGVVIAAVAVLAVALSSGGTHRDTGLAANWSAWQPADRSIAAGAAEIAAHVGPHYRLDDGKQLVAVDGGPLQFQSIPLGVAVRPQNGNIQLLQGKGVLYTLNGLGPGGSIAAGKKSAERHLLLRREALELALYSFRYLGAEMVVTLLPPPPPEAGSTTATSTDTTQPQAIFYRPGDLASELQVPLGLTLPRANQLKPALLRGAEARRVDSLTLSNLFVWNVQQAQDSKAYIVLSRPA
jgi:hypothetical protein